jgi:hypothetical protein
MGNLVLPSRFGCGIRSFGMLCGMLWQLVTEVSGQLIGLIIKGRYREANLRHFTSRNIEDLKR